MGYLLDTNTVSDILRRDRTVSERYLFEWKNQTPMYVSVMTLIEIKRGLRYKAARNKAQLFEAMSQLLPTLWLDNAELAEHAINIHNNLRRRGQPIPEADVLIAATAQHHNLTVVTSDQHFSRISDLSVINWRG